MANGPNENLAWVTGASGFIGGHVARTLNHAGYRVLGFARDGLVDHTFPPPPIGVAASRLGSGRFEGTLLRQLIGEFGVPRLVFHAIGSGSVGQAAAAPKADAERTIGTLQILCDALAEAGGRTRLIYPSSAAVYGDAGDCPIAETNSTWPISTYGRNKLAAEDICRRFALEHGAELVILRLFSVFGAPQRKLLFWDLVQRILSGEETVKLGGSGRETRDFIHIRDVAAAVTLLSRLRDPPQILNIGSGYSMTIAKAATLFVGAIGVPARIEFSGMTRLGDPENYCADIRRLRGCGFTPTISQEAGIAEYAAWVRQLGLMA